MEETIDLILFGDNKDYHDQENHKIQFEVGLPHIINALNSHCDDENVSKLIQCFQNMAQRNCRVEGKTGCVITKIRDVPFHLAQQCKEIVEESDSISKALQNGIMEAAHLSTEIANDTYAVELSDSPSKKKNFYYNEQVSNILLYETSAFNPKNCLSVCRLISKCIGVLREEAWFLDGRFMLFGLSSQMNPIRLSNALTSDDSVDIFREWKNGFCAQIRGTPLEDLFDTTSDTLSINTNKYYYVAFIVGTEFIPKAVHYMENIFRKLKISITKQVDKYVFPHLKNLTKKDETLRMKIFGQASYPLNEESWVSHCLSSNCNEEALSEFMEIRKKLLEAMFNLLSTQTRVRDPNYKKFVCLSDPSKIFNELPPYQTREEAQEAAQVTNYYPPVSFIGQLGIDFISHSESPPPINSDLIFYISSVHVEHHTMPYFQQISFGSTETTRPFENMIIAYDTGNPHTVLWNNRRMALALTKSLSISGEKSYWTHSKIGQSSNSKYICLGNQIILPSDRGLDHKNDLFVLLGINYLMEMNHGILGNSLGRFIIAHKDVIDSFLTR